MKQSAIAALAAHLVSTAYAGTVVWDGRFNDMTSATDLDKWSWSNQVGPYQWYIHGSSDTTAYVNLAANYANPADTSVTKGVKLTLDSTAYWNGQNMRRTELIPQTSKTSAISSGTVYYHFSMMRSDTNAPSVNREHQIAFFESHFTEMKYGWISGESGTSDNQLRWMANSKSQWNTTFEPGVWHNCVYEIDFAAKTVGFWHSTGGDKLTQAVAPVSASTNSNGADWHLGVLELARDGYSDTAEDLYFSGVYVESGDLTTTFGGSSSSSSGSTTAVASSSAAASTPAASTSSAAAVASPSSSSSAAAVKSSASSRSSSATSAKAVATSDAVETPLTTVVKSTSTSAATSTAAPATTSASSSKTCVKRTKTVYVTMSA